jgi:hypothetical protein
VPKAPPVAAASHYGASAGSYYGASSATAGSYYGASTATTGSYYGAAAAAAGPSVSQQPVEKKKKKEKQRFSPMGFRPPKHKPESR